MILRKATERWPGFVVVRIFIAKNRTRESQRIEFEIPAQRVICMSIVAFGRGKRIRLEKLPDLCRVW